MRRSKKLFGNTGGLKANHTRRLENLYRRRIPTEFLITSELAKDISMLSREIRRQIGLTVNRQGKITAVIVGDRKKIVIPSTGDYRAAPGRLKGLRCIHTHLDRESLTRDDFTDLALLRLDMMAVILSSEEGQPLEVHAAHILPGKTGRHPYQLLPVLKPWQLDIDCLAFIQALEEELARVRTAIDADLNSEKAFLVSASSGSKKEADESLSELKELARSGGLEVIGTISQQRNKADPRFLMGLGRLQDLAILALQKSATIIIFDQELNPAQIRSITNKIDLKVIDRTQLILDIFAQRARSREGKHQVELAQLKYVLPRLVGKNTAMSRLTGGIGGRGPGETKLEVDRRRVRERISHLEKALSKVRKQRRQQRAKRSKKELPVISIIGYTNAGKSTLLNTLTKSRVLAESRLFATLDPSSRRLRFPKETEVIITDTVGFIRDLPKDLMVAFRATLEELEAADLLVHVIDISNPSFEGQIRSVEKILTDLNLQRTTCIKVLNKNDLVPVELSGNIARRHNAVAISARRGSTLIPLVKKMEKILSDAAAQMVTVEKN